MPTKEEWLQCIDMLKQIKCRVYLDLEDRQQRHEFVSVEEVIELVNRELGALEYQRYAELKKRKQ